MENPIVSCDHPRWCVTALTAARAPNQHWVLDVLGCLEFSPLFSFYCMSQKSLCCFVIGEKK